MKVIARSHNFKELSPDSAAPWSILASFSSLYSPQLLSGSCFQWKALISSLYAILSNTMQQTDNLVGEESGVFTVAATVVGEDQNYQENEYQVNK